MRIPRYLMFLEMAQVLAKRSTCYRGNVGAIITYKHNVISTGYNGPASGEPHCSGNQCEVNASGGCKRSIHAEVNALNRMLPELITKPLDFYCTTCPCFLCAEFILARNPRLIKFFFQGMYSSRAGIDKLMNGLPDTQFFRVTPAGYCIDQRTGQLVNEA